jgi:hypothetical protein
VLGLSFIALKLYEYSLHFQEGIYPGAQASLVAVFFMELIDQRPTNRFVLNRDRDGCRHPHRAERGKRDPVANGSERHQGAELAALILVCTLIALMAADALTRGVPPMLPPP